MMPILLGPGDVVVDGRAALRERIANNPRLDDEAPEAYVARVLEPKLTREELMKHSRPLFQGGLHGHA